MAGLLADVARRIGVGPAIFAAMADYQRITPSAAGRLRASRHDAAGDDAMNADQNGHDAALRNVRLHPFEIELAAEGVLSLVAALRRVGDHELADLHEARAFQLVRATR